tara:strand:+ start:185 stop:322 length:138 start_codon:yes stop_codon:yes gene_type:complete
MKTPNIIFHNTTINLERRDSETNLLPIIMQAANGQRDSVSIFGND